VPSSGAAEHQGEAIASGEHPGRGTIIAGAILLPIGVAALAGGVSLLIKDNQDNPPSSFGPNFSTNSLTGVLLSILGVGLAPSGTILLAIGLEERISVAPKPRADKRSRLSGIQLQPYSSADGGGLLAVGRF
jgi:hypothetical protein